MGREGRILLNKMAFNDNSGFAKEEFQIAKDETDLGLITSR
jgi:hypothetical protein